MGEEKWMGREERGKYLHLFGKFPKIHVHPTIIAPIRHERTPDTRIQHNELPILLPQIICLQDLSIGTEIIAVVFPLDDPDVG